MLFKRNCFSKGKRPFDSRFERKDSTNQYTFNLKAANGEIIRRSEVYTSYTARETGIVAVKRDASYVPIEDCHETKAGVEPAFFIYKDNNWNLLLTILL
jgi:uncharacterized protein YegP (UPF0339 family)